MNKQLLNKLSVSIYKELYLSKEVIYQDSSLVGVFSLFAID
jgi:hypothetical protein